MPPASTARSRLPLALALGLAVVTAAVYARVADLGFVNFDDPEYVTDNPAVRAGLGWAGVGWALLARHSANWHPLTWLSHMLDVSLFGLRPGPHHLVSAGLHVANAVLLFALLVRTTAAVWPSLVVAMLFALHPLHVESVAWISERKDVLSTVCALVALHAYVGWVARPTAARYGAVAVALAAGLLAKPMVVTLPVVLLLLDVWPLRRTEPLARRVREKAPLFVLAALASALTVVAQREAGAVETLDAAPLAARAANALNSYVVYLTQAVWPRGLAVFYPYPTGYAAAWVAVCGALLAGATVAAVRAGRRRPEILVGWLWYLVTLLPVIGLVRVGDQARADRFTYVPLIGPFVIVAWGLPALLPARPWRPIVLGAAAAAAACACAALTTAQLATWTDSETLFRHALAVTRDNHVAETNLGTALVDRGQTDEAIAHFTAALRLRPTYARAHVNLGAALARRGDTAAAIAHYTDALALDPTNALAHYDLGHLLAAAGRTDEAIAAYQAALHTDPGYAKAYVGLGLVYAASNRLDDAAARYRDAVRLRPDMVEAHGNLALALEGLGRPDEAITEYRAVIALAPDDVRGHFNLGAALAGRGRTPEAVEEARTLARIAAVARRAGRTADATEAAERAIELARTTGAEALARDLVARRDPSGGGASDADRP